ncbi:MAG: NtaA/DmoA family FMN-dependent monooxygenase, partial [Rhodospirillales bacterium]|nr:NtaA/DmoA family FMN-dependent monooxygenase [Rhodospirillales bacterium]
EGKYFSVRGPLNIARPVQGWPVIVQAGASEAGRQLAAETAEVIFGAARSLKDGQEFYADIHRRMAAIGRPDDSLKILPAAMVVAGRTHEEAQEKKKRLDSLVHPDSAMPNLSMRLGVDATKFDLDSPLPELPPTNASQSAQASLVKMAREQNLTVRQLAQFVGGYGGLQFIGTPGEIADGMQEWLESKGSDGFNIMFHTVPEGLNDFVDLVVPELTRRGIYREAYEGTTLREHLGLKRPGNQFFR